MIHALSSMAASMMVAALPVDTPTPRPQQEEAEQGLCKSFLACSSQGWSSWDNRTLKNKDYAEKAARMEYLWQELFSDPSQWWDNRLSKKSSMHPDFKHKTTLEALWINSWLNPPWITEKFSTMTCDRIQSSLRSISRIPASIGKYDKVQKLSYEGRVKEALDVLELMIQQASQAPHGAFVCLLRACTIRKALAEGKKVHALIVKTKFDTNIVLSNLLIGMYSACGSVAVALKVFTAMPQRNVFSWNYMISAYARSGQHKETVILFQQMHQTGIEPDEVVCVIALKACANIAALEQGQQLHSVILKRRFDTNPIVQTALVDMYAKCGCLEDARKLFDNMIDRDVICWTAMIAGYAQKGFGKEALDLYKQMKHKGLEPNNFTLGLLLKACASISALQQGKQLHSLILKRGLGSDIIIQTTLLDMYSKCGCLEDARKEFDNMAKRNLVSWTAMIAGYVQKGLGKEALDLYEQMEREAVEPDTITLVLLLKACASMSALQQGKRLHSLIFKKGMESEMTVQTTLVEMYSKCGCLEAAREVFASMRERNVISWNAMIAGYALDGLGKEALELLEQMEEEGLQADGVTYSCLLSACNHAGLVDEGCHLFERMPKNHGVTPTLKHYACIVDLLGRAGRLSDAEDVILKMPIQPDKAVWMSLLGAARNYANVEIGRRAFQHVVELEPENAAPYLLLIDVYSAAGRMAEVAMVNKELDHKGLMEGFVSVKPALNNFDSMATVHWDVKSERGLMMW